MVLENLFDNYMEFEEIINSKKDDKIDIENLNLNPAAVLPLLCECKNENLKLTTGEDAYEYLKPMNILNHFWITISCFLHYLNQDIKVMILIF